ncbi:MAG: GrpB family protein [Saprospiraceae bacterium]
MKIELTPSSPLWPHHFAEIRAELGELLSDLQPRIEHIGSTAVPGLASKPIIDVLIGLPESVQLDKVIAPLIAAGYTYYETYTPVMPFRRFFAKIQPRKEGEKVPEVITAHDTNPDELGFAKTAHIHVVYACSAFWDRHLAFREYLKEHPEVREKYQLLKLALSEHEWKNGQAYNAAKSDFLNQEEAKALEWCKKRTTEIKS